VRLESVVEMRIGKTPARAKKKKYWNLHDYPWVKISDFTDTGVIAGSQEQISSVAFREVFKGRLVPAGTLLMSFKLTIGKCAILDIAAVHNEAIISIFPQCNIVNRDYLFYCLPTITQFGIQRSAVKGNTLNSKSLNALPLPLPPLTEQKTIVAYLDEKLGKINSVREKLQDFLDHAAQHN
jgi:type I restriction enzyme S subunit